MFKLSGQPRRQYKKELAALKCSIRHFWHYHQLDKDMASFYGGEDRLMSGQAAEDRFNEITEQIRVMEMKLQIVI